jgi:hypothetical protein
VNINHFPKLPLPDFSKLLSHISKTFQSSKKTGSNLHVNRLKSDSKVKQGKKCARKEKSPRRAKNTQFSGFGFFFGVWILFDFFVVASSSVNKTRCQGLNVVKPPLGGA